MAGKSEFNINVIPSFPFINFVLLFLDFQMITTEEHFLLNNSL